MIGSFATSKAGHDRQKIYVILDQNDDFVLLCDGHRRTIARPKKKKKKHIQRINQKVKDALVQRLLLYKSDEQSANLLKQMDDAIMEEIDSYIKNEKL